MFGSMFCRFESSREDVREEVLLKVPGFRACKGDGAAVLLLVDVVEAFLINITVSTHCHSHCHILLPSQTYYSSKPV